MDYQQTERTYDFDVVRWFSIMAIIYLVVGTAVGLLIASQLAWPALNFDSQYLSFGRLRPLHTNAVIFAFGGCTLMATSFYSVQRTCGTALWSSKMAWFTFWGWNTVIVLAVITLPLPGVLLLVGADVGDPDVVAAAVLGMLGDLRFGLVADGDA